MVGPGQVRLEEVPLPEVTEESIVVKTQFSGISTGTEMRLYDGHVSQIGIQYPLIPGYEEVGEVVFTGDKVRGFKVGDRVMANEVYQGYTGYTAAWGGQVAYAVIGPHTVGVPPEKWAVPIPAEVSYEEAVVAYLASVAHKGCAKIPVTPGATAVVTGQGLIGISALQLLKLRGAQVIASDLFANRLAVSRKYADHLVDASAEDVVDRVREITGGRMADIVFEASGNSEVAGRAISLSHGSARLHFQSAYTKPVVFSDFIWFSHSDRIMQGSSATSQVHKVAVLELIRDGRFDARSMITEVRSIEDASAAYAEVRAHKDKILKLLFRWE
jgi:2-desacetyl-2-hydroxyethyl bacteriochlorophyllide A dehydrogenase